MKICLYRSPVLDKKGVPVGRLSGIVAHYVLGTFNHPTILRFALIVLTIGKKIDAIIEETINKNMTLISGIPPWIQMYFERIVARTGKEISAVFPSSL